jgi:hypothetical protein
MTDSVLRHPEDVTQTSLTENSEVLWIQTSSCDEEVTDALLHEKAAQLSLGRFREDASTR